METKEVRMMTREQIIALAKEIWGKTKWTEAQIERLERFATLISSHERDACANLVAVHDKTFNTGGVFAGSIRNRIKK
jgi:hypothetical protein